MKTTAYSQFIDSGIKCEQQGNVLGSIISSVGALELNPQASEVHINLAKILLKQNACEEAAICYKRALEIDSKNSSVYSQLEKVLEGVENYDLFLELLNNHLAEKSNSFAKICFQIGQLLRKQGKYKNAIDFYLQSIENDSSFAAPYISLQFVPTPPEQLDELITFYRQLLAKDSQNILAWGNLGDIYSTKNDLPQAIECYQQGCYHQTIITNPQLAERKWGKKKQNSPDFIIAGVSKCGTSSLQLYLGHHSQILLPHKKEIDFFRRNFHRGVDWYLAHFPSITDLPEFLTGDATPTYFESYEAPRRIHNLFPDTKIIVLLRNPINRTISWHYHKVSRGSEKRSLEEVIETEIKELEQYSESDLERVDYNYKSNLLGSLYVYKLKEWFKYFPREQVLIIKSEDLYKKPEETTNLVYQYLGIESQSIPQYSKRNSGSYKPASDSIKQKLGEFFQPHNSKLEAYLGQKFNWS